MIENSLWLWQNWSMNSEHKIKISEKFRVTKDQETKYLTLEIILALYIVIFSNQLSSIRKTRNFQGKCSSFCSSALFHQKDNLSPRWVPSKCILTWDLIIMKQLSCFRPSLWIKNIDINVKWWVLLKSQAKISPPFVFLCATQHQTKYNFAHQGNNNKLLDSVTYKCGTFLVMLTK